MISILDFIDTEMANIRKFLYFFFHSVAETTFYFLFKYIFPLYYYTQVSNFE